MYKRRIGKYPSLRPSTSTAKPTPVYQSQNAAQENENENDEDIIISQENKPREETERKSRFSTQRQALLCKTQEQLESGKGALEIALSNLGLVFSEIGAELEDETDDIISFTRRFRSFLSTCSQKIPSYINDFEENFVLASQQSLCEAFMRGIFVTNGHQKYQSQTSVLMCFFAINSIKEQIAKILLKQLKTYATCEDPNALIIALVLTQFKFSDQLLSEDTHNLLFEELFAILGKLKSTECRAAITYHFRDLDIPKQKEAARRLCTMYQRNTDILELVNIFNDLSLDENTSTQIFTTILESFDDDIGVIYYTPILKYAFYYSTSLDEIIYMIRERMRWEACNKTIKKDMFKLINKSFIRDGKKNVDTWIKRISCINNSDDLKYIDFVMLLLIAGTNTETHMMAVKKIILDKTSKGLFNEHFIRDAFKIFGAVLADSSQTFLELLEALQKTKDNQHVIDFLKTCYKLLFRHSNEIKPIIGSLVNCLCEKKSKTPFLASEFKLVIINILNEIRNDKIQSAAALIFNYKILLRAIDLHKVELTLNEHRLYIDMLASLVYRTDFKKSLSGCQLKILEESKDSLQEHLNMIVNKCMNNPDFKIRQLGMIGGVKIVSALVYDYIDETDIDDDLTIESIPKGPIRDAANYVELLRSAADCESSELYTLLYDEMAMEFRPNEEKLVMNETFLSWLENSTLQQFETLFVQKNEKLPDVPDFKLDFLYEFTDDAFEDPGCAAKLGILVFEEKSSKIDAMPSLLRLTRLLTFQRYANLENIENFFCCPIILYDNFGTADDSLNPDPEKAKMQLDLYFLFLNWFRELIGGFIHSANFIESDFIIKFIKCRFKQLIKAEKVLNELLKDAPSGYIPSFLGFQQNEAQKKAFEGIMKIKEKKNDSIAKPPKKSRKKNESAVASEKEAKKGNINIKASDFCRDLENEVVILLKQDFNFDEISCEDENFALEELLYLLADIHKKVQIIFRPRNSEQKQFVKEIMALEEFKETLLPFLSHIFNKIVDKLKELSDDEQSDIDLESEERQAMLTHGFTLVLQIYETIFSSRKLKLDGNANLLADMLKIILIKKDKLPESQDLLCTAIIEQYLDLEDHAKMIDGAMALINLICSVNSLCKSRVNEDEIFSMCERFLHNPWKGENGQLEHGSAMNAHLQKLFKLYVDKAKTIDQMEQLVEEIETITKTTEFNKHKTLPCVTKANSVGILRVYISRLSQLITSTPSSKIDFIFWERCCNIQTLFINIIKWVKSAASFNIYLRHFVVFLRRFNSDGIKLLNKLVKSNQVKFIELVKMMQHVRRNAHGAGCDLLHRKNINVVNILPTVRKTFETFFQEALKIAKKSNIPESSFTIGTLRNFNINGEDIFSQNTISTNTTQTTDSDVMDVDEDVTDDEDMESDRNESHRDSASSSFRSRSTIF